jgi:hypothetical protein
MPRSDSGRIVIDLDPEFKKELYSALQEDDCSLKTWFVERATDYVEDKKQPSLFASQPVDAPPRNGLIPHNQNGKGGKTL